MGTNIILIAGFILIVAFLYTLHELLVDIVAHLDVYIKNNLETINDKLNKSEPINLNEIEGSLEKINATVEDIESTVDVIKAEQNLRNNT